MQSASSANGLCYDDMVIFSELNQQCQEFLKNSCRWGFIIDNHKAAYLRISLGSPRKGESIMKILQHEFPVVQEFKYPEILVAADNDMVIENRF